MKNLLLMLFALLAVIGERLSSAIEQAGELLTSRTGFVGEFIMNESGRVNPEQGFRVAWAAGSDRRGYGRVGHAAKSCGSSSMLNH